MTTGMKQLLCDVHRFHMACGVDLRPAAPGFPGHDEMALARLLIDDEYEELKKVWHGDRDEDISDFADALADLIYVLIRAALVCGIPLDRVWEEVQAANMRKAGGPRRTDGKLMKPADWVGPDIHRAIWGAGGEGDNG